jgi:hypothetical protein
MKLFHYTAFLYLTSIHDAGCIRRTMYENGNGLVWLSTREPWEPGAGKVIRHGRGTRHMTFEEQREKLGCARFELIAPLRTVPWSCVPMLTGFSEVLCMGIEALNRGIGADPNDWRCYPHDIELKHVRLEVWESGKWRGGDLASIAEQLRPMAAEVGACRP